MISGYLIFRREKEQIYRGLDRLKIEPELPDLAAIDSQWRYPPDIEPDRIWPFWPEHSWQRAAYRLYEENCIGSIGEVWLVTDLLVAEEIARIARFGESQASLEVLLCECWAVPSAETLPATSTTGLGFDAAFRGGDCFSIVRQLLEGRLTGHWLDGLDLELNENGLLSASASAQRLIEQFQRNSPSYADPDLFAVWRVSDLGR